MLLIESKSEIIDVAFITISRNLTRFLVSRKRPVQSFPSKSSPDNERRSKLMSRI